MELIDIQTLIIMISLVIGYNYIQSENKIIIKNKII